MEPVPVDSMMRGMTLKQAFDHWVDVKYGSDMNIDQKAKCAQDYLETLVDAMNIGGM